MLLYTPWILKRHSYSPTLECYLCCMRSQAKYVLFLSHIFLSLCLATFPQLYSGGHGNECSLRGGILVFLLQRMRWREGKRKDMHSFHLCLWRVAFVSTLGQVREKKTEFKAKHLRAFKMVLLICTLLDLHVTIHAEQTGHILPGTDQSTFRIFFSDFWFQDTPGGIHTYIFIKKILSTWPKLLNTEIIVNRMPNVFLM